MRHACCCRRLHAAFLNRNWRRQRHRHDDAPCNDAPAAAQCSAGGVNVKRRRSGDHHCSNILLAPLPCSTYCVLCTLAHRSVSNRPVQQQKPCTHLQSAFTTAPSGLPNSPSHIFQPVGTPRAHQIVDTEMRRRACDLGQRRLQRGHLHSVSTGQRFPDSCGCARAIEHLVQKKSPPNN